MKKQSFTLDQAADIQKITGVPCKKVVDAFKGIQCSYERFRHFCLNQGALPSIDQQIVLNEQELKGQLYDYPTQKMIDKTYATVVRIHGWSGTMYNLKGEIIGYAKRG